MEIRDYLKIIRHRLWILIVLPVLAAIVAFVLFSGKPQQYQSKVETAVPSLAQNTTAGAVGVYVASFQEFLTTQPVIDRVSRETGVSGHKLRAGLAAGQVGNSNLIEVTYTSSDKSVVEKVALSATSAALDTTSSPDLIDAKSAVQVAQTQYNKAQTAVQQLVSTVGGIPEDQYRDKLNSLAALKLAASSARLDLDIPKANGLDAQIPQVMQELTDLLPQVEQYQQLTDAQQQASNALSSAFVREQQAEAEVSAHADPVVLKNSTPTTIGGTTKLISSVGVVAGVALILAALLIVFLELIGAARARRTYADLHPGSPLTTDGDGGVTVPSPPRATEPSYASGQASPL